MILLKDSVYFKDKLRCRKVLILSFIVWNKFASLTLKIGILVIAALIIFKKRTTFIARMIFLGGLVH